jgi:hypothetical protein
VLELAEAGSLSPVELAGSAAMAAAVMVDFKNSRLLVPIVGNGLENLEWMAIARPAKGMQPSLRWPHPLAI